MSEQHTRRHRAVHESLSAINTTLSWSAAIVDVLLILVQGHRYIKVNCKFVLIIYFLPPCVRGCFSLAIATNVVLVR